MNWYFRIKKCPMNPGLWTAEASKSPYSGKWWFNEPKGSLVAFGACENDAVAKLMARLPLTHTTYSAPV